MGKGLFRIHQKEHPSWSTKFWRGLAPMLPQAAMGALSQYVGGAIGDSFAQDKEDRLLADKMQMQTMKSENQAALDEQTQAVGDDLFRRKQLHQKEMGLRGQEQDSLNRMRGAAQTSSSLPQLQVAAGMDPRGFRADKFAADFPGTLRPSPLQKTPEQQEFGKAPMLEPQQAQGPQTGPLGAPAPPTSEGSMPGFLGKIFSPEQKPQPDFMNRPPIPPGPMGPSGDSIIPGVEDSPKPYDPFKKVDLGGMSAQQYRNQQPFRKPRFDPMAAGSQNLPSLADQEAKFGGELSKAVGGLQEKYRDPSARYRGRRGSLSEAARMRLKDADVRNYLIKQQGKATMANAEGLKNIINKGIRDKYVASGGGLVGGIPEPEYVTETELPQLVRLFDTGELEGGAPISGNRPTKNIWDTIPQEFKNTVKGLGRKQIIQDWKEFGPEWQRKQAKR